MTTTVSYDVHIQAVAAALNAAPSLNIGRGRQPSGTGWQGPPGQSPFVPYGIVWRIGAKDAVNLSLDDNKATEARLLVYIRVFGGTASEAEHHLDKVHARMMAEFPVPGRRLVSGNGVTMDNGQTTTRTETTEIGLYEAGNFYRIRTVPEG